MPFLQTPLYIQHVAPPHSTCETPCMSTLHAHLGTVVCSDLSTSFDTTLDRSRSQTITILSQSQTGLPLLHRPFQVLQSSQVEAHGVFQPLHPLPQQPLQLDQGGPG